MEGTPEQFTGSSTPEAFVIDRMKQTAMTMSAWLKFLGIVTIIGGALSVISIVGIIIAWLPIWLGVLLFQAGDRAHSARYSDDLNYLVQMMEKLKLYFMINAVLMIIGIAFMVLIVAFAGSVFNEIGNMFPGIMDAY
jgi:hypothetical protein